MLWQISQHGLVLKDIVLEGDVLQRQNRVVDVSPSRSADMYVASICCQQSYDIDTQTKLKTTGGEQTYPRRSA